MSYRAKYKARLRKKLSQGHDREAAEYEIRGMQRPVTVAKNFPQQRESIAVSVGPGWRSQGANIGTDAVVFPDLAETVTAWMQERARLQPADEAEWLEHAKRIGLSEDQAEEGWECIKAQPDFAATLALEGLSSVFDESVSWSGYWVPNKALIDPNKRAVKAPKPKSERFSVNIKTTQAPTIGTAPGVAGFSQSAPGFPFRTRSAEMVWKFAQQLILAYPESPPQMIVQRALGKSGVPAAELSPEDMQMLAQAVEFAQNGPARTNVRIGGMPGGPSRLR